VAAIFSERVQQVRDTLSEWHVEGLLVTNPANCRWLSGFSGSFSALLITASEAVLATDSRYWEQAANQAPDFELFRTRRTEGDMARFVTSVGVSPIGFEANYVPFQQAQQLQAIKGVSWQPLHQTVEPMRMVKTEEEITLIQAAAAITDAAMTKLPDFLTPGIPEVELAWRLERHMRETGASGTAFPLIVAFGSNSALPHHAPGERKLREGEIVLVDMGAKLNGYHSDLTRTYFYGKTADPRFQDVFDIVLAAQTAALNQIKAGTNTVEAHLAAANVIIDAGFGENFGHGLGHGLGLQIHEDPYLSAVRDPQVIKNNCTITIEPGLYFPGWGGVRIEDLVQVTPRGTKPLSRAPKNTSFITS
jgi:Xaa-Pro aminopeptidase